jgi:hypothetical protein
MKEKELIQKIRERLASCPNNKDKRGADQFKNNAERAKEAAERIRGTTKWKR